MGSINILVFLNNKKKWGGGGREEGQGIYSISDKQEF